MRASSQLASPEYLRLLRRPWRELEALMHRGEPPHPDELAGWEFRGTNTLVLTKLVGIRKFMKGFYRDRLTGALRGYNVPVVQNGLEAPWIAKPHDAQPRRFAFFSVDPVDAGARDNAFLNAVLLDYSRGRNFSLDPANTLRDYLVRAGEGLYLGKAYVAVGPTRVPVSHLVLERHRPHDFVR